MTELRFGDAVSDFVEIPLMPLQSGFTALVSPEDLAFLNQWRWRAHPAGAGIYYAMRTSRKDVPQSRFMHRVILNAPKGVPVDHRNRNGLDNRRSNLRLCSWTENGRNRGAVVGTSRYKGVSYSSSRQGWRAAISVADKVTYLGIYADEVDAACVYNESARHLFGEFACLNELPPGYHGCPVRLRRVDPTYCKIRISDRPTVCELYKSGMRIMDIAQRYDVRRDTIRRTLRMGGIPAARDAGREARRIGGLGA